MFEFNSKAIDALDGPYTKEGIYVDIDAIKWRNRNTIVEGPIDIYKPSDFYPNADEDGMVHITDDSYHTK